MGRPIRLDATDRVNLLLSFVPYLLENSPVTVTELASVFDVSTENVRELVRLLAMSGVPGDSGMYQHQDLFDIDWDAFENDDEVVLWNHIAVDSTPRLSQLEAASLIAGLQYIAGLADNSSSVHIEQLINKLSRGSHASPQPITITHNSVPSEVAIINEAISSGVSIACDYASPSSVHNRRVDPIRLDLVGQQWYLRGWCHMREELRTFRLSRMSNLSITAEKRLSSVTASELPDELFDVSDSTLIVSAEAPAHALGLIGEYQPENVHEKTNGMATFDVRLSSIDAVVPFVVSSGGVIRIVSPTSAIEVLERWVAAALSYQKDAGLTA